MDMMPGVWDYGRIMVRSAREQDDGAVGFSKCIYPYRSSLVAEPIAPHGVAGSRGQTDATRRGCSVVDDQHVEELEQEDVGHPQIDGQEVALKHEASREVARVETVPEDHRGRECQSPKSEREACKRDPKSEREVREQDQPHQEEPRETAMIRGEPEHREPFEGKPTAGEEAAGSCQRMMGVESKACHKRSGQGEEAIDQRGRTGAGSTAGEEAGDQLRRTWIVEEHVRRDVCKIARRRRS